MKEKTLLDLVNELLFVKHTADWKTCEEATDVLMRQHTALQDLKTECAALRVNEENLTAQVESLRAQLAARVPDADEMAKQIRWVSGANKMGAGALAENLCNWIASRLSAAPSQQAPTNCRHCGGPDSVLCAGQCKAKQPAKDIGVEQDERVFARIKAMKAKQQAPVAQGEPVGWVAPRPDVVDWSSYEPEIGTPLYTTPQPAREPMTPEQVEDGYRGSVFTQVSMRHAFEKGVRFAERHHKIKGKQ
jgi:hypothetical protein